jgi:hypothetical protein
MKRDVIVKILQNVKNKGLRDKLIQKVNNEEDLTIPESIEVYKNVDYGEILKMNQDQHLDIDWTNHAEYRSDLKDVDHEQLNKDVKNKLQFKKPNSKGFKERIQTNSGTAILDYDTSQNPAEAEIITTWASENEIQNFLGENKVTELKFATTKEAIQHLSNVTNKKIIISSSMSYLHFFQNVASPEEIKKSTEETADMAAKKSEINGVSTISQESKAHYRIGALFATYESLYKKYQQLYDMATQMEEYIDDISQKIEKSDMWENLNADVFKPKFK